MSKNSKQQYPSRGGASGGTSGRDVGDNDDVTEATPDGIPTGGEAQGEVVGRNAKVFVTGKDGKETLVGLSKDLSFSPSPAPAFSGPIIDIGEPVLVSVNAKGTFTDVPTTKKKPTKLQLLVEEMTKTEKRATVDLEFTDIRTRSGREQAKREAQELFKVQREQYTAALKPGLCAMFLVGPRQQAFASLAQLEGPTPVVVVEADRLYRAIAQEVESTMRTDRMFEPTQHARMQQTLISICQQLELAEAPSPTFAAGFLLKTQEDVVAHVRSVVRGCVGDSLNIHFLQRLVNEECWKIRYQEYVVPVIVTGATADEVKGLGSFFNQKSIVVATGGGTDRDSMMKAFTALKNKLRS